MTCSDFMDGPKCYILEREGALLSPIDAAREGGKADILQLVCIGKVQTTPAAYKQE